jgi:hypothetical protein
MRFNRYSGVCWSSTIATGRPTLSITTHLTQACRCGATLRNGRSTFGTTSTKSHLQCNRQSNHRRSYHSPMLTERRSFLGGCHANLIQYYDTTRNYTFFEEQLMPLLRGISDSYVSYVVPSIFSIFGAFSFSWCHCR